MRSELLPLERLSQIVFIHDYIQLVFQHDIFTIYNAAEVSIAKATFQQRSPGFADALLTLIEKRATTVTSSAEYSLQILFENGTLVNVVRGCAGTRGPEAWQFSKLGGPVVVEPND
jgi:hypothetical protein